MSYDVERRPAEWVSRRATRQELALFAAGLVALAACAAVFVLAHERRGGGVGTSGALLLLAVLLLARPRANRWADSVLNWRKGAVAEQAVGELLNELRYERWIVMHDLEQAGEGNIDHLVSGPHGVYLVETKFRRYERRDLTKAKRQAAKLHDQLGVWVTPVICLFDRSDEPFHAERVAVVPRQHLLGWLREQHNPPVDFERLARYAETV